MLRMGKNQSRILLWLVLAAAGCCQTQDRIETREIWRSKPQSLSIRNGTSNDLLLVPGDNNGGDALPLPQGDTATVQFLAIREAEFAVPEDGGSAEPLKGSTRQSLTSAGGTGFLSFSDGDYGITIEFPGEVRHRFIVEACPEWFESPPGAGGKVLNITEPPMIGLPANICP